MIKKITWYINRLSCMSIAEIAHRIKTKLLTSMESGATLSKIADSELNTSEVNLKLLEHLDFEERRRDITEVRNMADSIVAGELTVFTLKYQFVSFPDWNKDPKTGIHAPLVYGKTLDYRNEAIVGDIKYLWEPSRHLHFPVLAYAFRLSGDIKYLECLSQHMRSWIDQCPHLLGPHWVSSLELGIRLINWCMTWNILRDSLDDMFDLPGGQKLKKDWLRVIEQHVRFINGHYSRYSSANNHLIGEAAGVFVASMCWPLNESIVKSGKKAKDILEKEALNQNHSDGVNKEQAISYQQFVLDFLLIPYLIGEKYGNKFSEQYSYIIQKMLKFLASIMDVSGNIPMIGDADDGFVFRFSWTTEHCPYKSLLATGAVIFGRPEFKLKAGRFDNRTYLLLGEAGYEKFKSLDSGALESSAHSFQTEFPQGGYYILGDNYGLDDEYRMVMDVGSLGYGGIAAHGHADALAVYLSVKGNEFFVDPGTYAYHTDEKWRNYFKGTSAHNTIRIDQKDQSTSGGNFMWIKKAKSTLLKFEQLQNSIEIAGKHNGYETGATPVGHERNIFLNKLTGEFTISDKISCRSLHLVEQFWHLSEMCDVEKIQPNHFVITNREQRISVRFDDDIEIFVEKANKVDPIGWVSRSFDSKIPTYTFVGKTKISGDKEFKTYITLEI